MKNRRSGDPVDPTLVDIVVPVFGEFALAEKALDRVEKAAEPLRRHEYKIIVVDNGTPPWISGDSGERVEPDEMSLGLKDKLINKDQFIRLDQNIGYPGACNTGVQKGSAPLILILTSDVFLLPNAIHNLVRTMDNPEVGVAGMKLLFPLDMESPHGPGGTIQHAGLAFDIRGKPYHVHIGWSKDHPKVNERRVMAAVTGACLMTRRNLWTEVGGFDPRYGAGTFEDVDYCFAIRQMGKRVVYEPTAEGFHLVSGARLQGANAGGFNLPLNETQFRGKWAHMLAWDEWRYL